MALGFTALLLCACGSDSDDFRTPTTPEKDSVTPGMIKLGRFRSPDGTQAIVLDRTGPVPKLQVVGKKDIVELREHEVRRRGEVQSYEFFDPDGHRRLILGTSGALSLADGDAETILVYDASAPALGRATIAFAPKAEEPTWKQQSRELAGKSIVVKLPELKPEDASDLDKVALAFAKTDASSFMRYVERDKLGKLPRLDVAPNSVPGTTFGHQSWTTDDAESKRHKKLQAYGAVLQGNSDAQSQGNHIIVEAKDHHAPLASGTPGLIWSVENSTVTFVSFDGGRYPIDIAHDVRTGATLDATIGPETGWPKPVQDAFLDYTDVSRLVRMGIAPKLVLEQLTSSDQGWNECSQQVWAPANEKIALDQFRPAEAMALAARTQATCRKYLDQFETTLVGYIEQRKAARAALYEKAKARAKVLALDH